MTTEYDQPIIPEMPEMHYALLEQKRFRDGLMLSAQGRFLQQVLGQERVELELPIDEDDDTNIVVYDGQMQRAIDRMNVNRYQSLKDMGYTFLANAAKAEVEDWKRKERARLGLPREEPRLSYESDPYEFARKNLTKNTLTGSEYADVLEERFERTLRDLHRQQDNFDKHGPYSRAQHEVADATVVFCRVDEVALHTKRQMVRRMEGHLKDNGQDKAAQTIKRRAVR